MCQWPEQCSDALPSSERVFWCDVDVPPFTAGLEVLRNGLALDWAERTCEEDRCDCQQRSRTSKWRQATTVTPHHTPRIATAHGRYAVAVAPTRTRWHLQSLQSVPCTRRMPPATRRVWHLTRTGCHLQTLQSVPCSYKMPPATGRVWHPTRSRCHLQTLQSVPCS
jgi:hypothetical protein